MERGDLVIEFPRHIEDLRHFIGAIAMLVDEDFPLQHAGQGFEFQITLGGLGLGRLVGKFLVIFIPFLDITLRLDPGGAIGRHIAHAGRGAGLLAIDALGILAAGHLDGIRRAGKFHALRREGGDILDRDATPAKQICRARQDLHGGHPTGPRALESRIMGP